MDHQWTAHQPAPSVVDHIITALDLSPVTAAVLVNRNIVSAAAVRRFLDAPLRLLTSPHTLRDATKAADRLYQAIIKKEKILIFGDYDVDGVTATTLLYEFLWALDADVRYYIPHRIKEGYGLKPQHIDDYAIAHGIDLVVTADCGSSSHEAVLRAAASGIDVVITDHHRINPPYPSAVAVVNPKRKDCTAGLSNLAGVGVAFYVVILLRSLLRKHSFWGTGAEPNLKRYCDLVALGSMADMVPLIDDNRILARAGIGVIRSGKRPGLQALVEICGMEDQFIDGDAISYRLAPRLNAAGRVSHSRLAVQLLIAQEPAAANRISLELNRLNAERQNKENQILTEIDNTILKWGDKIQTRHALVLSSAWWHAGILGIAASRLVQRYHKPVVLISTDGGMGKGSARSIPGLDLYRAIEQCKDLLIGYGGHAMAAGIQIEPVKVSAFAKRFEQVTGAVLSEQAPAPPRFIDQEIDFGTITPKLVDELALLQPFGTQNPAPLFMTHDITVHSSRLVGTRHRQMVLVQNGGTSPEKIRAIQFNVDPEAPCPRHITSLVYHLGWNYWKGRKSIQVNVVDL